MPLRTAQRGRIHKPALRMQAETATLPTRTGKGRPEFRACIQYAPSACRQEISAEERHLNERRLKVVERESGAEAGNQNVVQIHAERPQEEERRDQNEGNKEASFGERRVRVHRRWLSRNVVGRCIPSAPIR